MRHTTPAPATAAAPADRPSTPVGITLPNGQALRERFGSKSMSLSNISEAHEKSTLPEIRNEFSWTPEEAERSRKCSAFASELTTNMHEVIGHGSGKVSDGLEGSSQAALEEQFSDSGFVMPRLEAIRDASGEIIDVPISYPLDLSAQMLDYSAATRHLRG